jgi:hypothetical protein
MQDRSFREILEQILEEKEPISHDKQEPFQRKFIVTEPLLEWRETKIKPSPKNPYGRTSHAETPRPKPMKKAIPLEKILKLEDLKPIDQAHLRTMIRLGANDLMNGISLTRVKTAYRRLAKMLHPDRSGFRDDFIVLQSAYEALSDLLNETNASVSGSEFASAPDYRRRDAA